MTTSEKMQIIYLEWLDSTGDGRWIDKKAAANMEVTPCESVGYLLKEDKEKIVITQSYDPENDNVMNTLTVPKIAIIKKQILTISKSRKSRGKDKDNDV